MRSTADLNGVPRILVRISGEDRANMSEKSITTIHGEKRTLYKNAPWLRPKDADGNYEPQDNNELTVRYGTVLGMGIGVSGYRKGDIVILDYTVDIDSSCIVYHDGDDKIVSIPCMTTFCKDELIATSYDEKFIERNVIVQKKGEVEYLSMVMGVVRKGVFIPNDHYIFCEPPVKAPEYIYRFIKEKKKPTHIVRKVIFAPKKSGLKQGDTIIAILESNMSLTLGDRPLEIIPITDIMAIDQSEAAMFESQVLEW
jgi:hypothetical protein